MDEGEQEELAALRRARWSRWQVAGYLVFVVFTIAAYALELQILFGPAGIGLAFSGIAALQADRSVVSGRPFPANLEPDGFDEAGHHLHGRTLLMVVGSLVLGIAWAILGFATGLDQLLRRIE